MGLQFLYMCDVNYSFFLLCISFHIRVHGCFGVLHATEKDDMQHGCVLIVLKYFSFRCGSHVSCICVEHNTPFCYAYHFISKCCVFHMYITTAVFNGRQLPMVLRCRVHVASLGKMRESCQASMESSAVYS
jgi:hypothetical protein